jgi:hypothetical protein
MSDTLKWFTVARVLLVEHRVCKCGASFEAPSSHTYIRQERFGSHNHTEQIIRFQDQFIPPYCPYQIERVATRLDSCPSCFTEREAYGQREMFPDFQAFPAAPTYEDEPADEDAPPPLILSLEDFLS